MFTGIIETLGVVQKIEKDRTNIHFSIGSPISSALKVDQSVSHNGVCLTVVACDAHAHTVTAIEETLNRTNLGNWTLGDLVNLERCMPTIGCLSATVKLVNSRSCFMDNQRRQ